MKSLRSSMIRVYGKAIGMTRFHTEGYIQIRKTDHHFADCNGYIMEHHLVWEQHNNAILLPWSSVHHINEIRTDNRIGNLIAFSRGQHSDHHLKERRENEINKRKCAYCGKGTRQRIKHCRGYTYSYSDWTRNQLNKSEWLCARCYLNQHRELYGRTK